MANFRKYIVWHLLSLILVAGMLSGCKQSDKPREFIAADQLDANTVQDTMSHYEEIMADSEQVIEKYLDEDGYLLPEKQDSALQEFSSYAQGLYEKGSITDYAYKAGDTCVYMEIDGWLSVLYSPPTEEFMSGGSDELEIITLEPNATEFYINYITSSGKGPDEAASKVSSTFNQFGFTEDFENSEVTIETFKKLPQKSIVIYNGHGGYNTEVGSVLFTGIDAWDQTTILLYTLEFGEKAIGINGDGEFFLTSIFFDKYVEEDAYDGSLFYLGACNTCTDARLAQSIWDKGARGIVCNTQATWINYNFQMLYSFFEGMTTKDSSGNYLTISQAVDYAKKQNGEKDPYIFGYGSEVVAYYRDDFTLQDMTAPAECEYNLDSNCALSVYDDNENLYGNYTLQITGTQFLHGAMLSSESLTYESTQVITSSEPYILKLEPGIYTFILTDNDDPTLIDSFTASVGGNNGKTALSVYTDFGRVSQKQLTKIIEYNQDGEQTAHHNFVYNDDGSVAEISASLSGYPLCYTYTYDIEGRLTEVVVDDPHCVGSSSSVKYLYNDKGQVAEEIRDSATFQYEYDNSGKIVNSTGGYGPYTSKSDYLYDENGRLIEKIEVRYLAGTSPDEAESKDMIISRYNYDESGKLLSESSESPMSSSMVEYNNSFSPLIVVGDWMEIQIPIYGEWEKYHIGLISGEEHEYISEESCLVEITYTTWNGDLCYLEFCYDGEEPNGVEIEVPAVEEQPVLLSEDEAYKIACEYYNCPTEFDFNALEAYETFVVSDSYGEVEQASTGEYYYSFRLMWKIIDEDGSVRKSTCDMIDVNAVTGECTYYD